MLMTLFVVPLGVVTARLPQRVRAATTRSPRAVRLALANLAGVPSIVFGAFGLAFFVYTVGGGIDRLLFADTLPTPTFGTGGILWASLTLALLTVPVVVIATEEGLQSVPQAVRDGARALGATRAGRRCAGWCCRTRCRGSSPAPSSPSRAAPARWHR